MNKTCTRCKTPKLINDFHVASKGKDGRQSWCRECSSVHHALQRNANLEEERIKERFWERRWRKENPEKAKEKDRRRRLANPNLDREKDLKRHFGITLQQYDEMFLAQDGVCAICKHPESVRYNKNSDKIKRLAVDHCHETGKIRGLLCTRCNPAVGYMQNDPFRAQSLFGYILHHSTI